MSEPQYYSKSISVTNDFLIRTGYTADIDHLIPAEHPEFKDGSISAFFAGSKNTLTIFMSKFNEFNRTYPQYSSGFLAANYAQSNHSMSEFMARFTKFMTKYPQYNGGDIRSFYAESNNLLCN